MITWPRSLSFALERRGIDVDALARDAGLADSALWAPDTHLPLRAYAAILERAIALVGDPALGLAVGSELRPELFGIVGQVAMLSATYGEALDMLARYKRIVAPERLETSRVGEHVLIRFIPEANHDPRIRVQVDAELAGLLCFGRRLTGASIVARAVYIAGPEVPYAAAYRDVFGCAPTFDAEVDALLVDAAVLDLPLRSANPELRELVRAHAEAKRAVAVAERLSGRVATELTRLLPHGEVTLDTVAARLGTSTRSLQRHLHDQGASFRGLLDDTRAQLARRYLERADLDPEDISFLLGFRHVQSFYRAFRRWTGETPESWRQGITTRSAPAKV